MVFIPLWDTDMLDVQAIEDPKAARRAEAVQRLTTDPTISVDDYALINKVSRNTAFKEVAEGRVTGAYKVGNQIRIPSVPLRQRLYFAASENHRQVA